MYNLCNKAPLLEHKLFDVVPGATSHRHRTILCPRTGRCNRLFLHYATVILIIITGNNEDGGGTSRAQCPMLEPYLSLRGGPRSLVGWRYPFVHYCNFSVQGVGAFACVGTPPIKSSFSLVTGPDIACTYEVEFVFLEAV